MLYGYNISLLAGWLAALLLTFLNRRAATPMVMVLLASYVALVRGDPAVVRAAIMGGLTLLALLAGRPAHALTGLAVSGWLMTLWNPWSLWEPGFQLSFAATLGLIAVLPRLEGWVEARLGGRKAPDWLREAVLVSLAAQISTLGTFRRLSLVAPLASLLILPVLAAVMELCALAAFLGLVWWPLGRAVAWLACPFLPYNLSTIIASNRAPQDC